MHEAISAVHAGPGSDESFSPGRTGTNRTHARGGNAADGGPEKPGQRWSRLSGTRPSRFKDVAQAEKEGYALQFGCVSGPPIRARWGCTTSTAP